MKKISPIYIDILLMTIGIGLLSYTSLRAVKLSMTHDESSSYLNYINQPLSDCFSSEACWGTANLHLINTFLMQISVKVFGENQLAVRLPNLLAHLMYLVFSFLLLRRLSDQWLWAILGFLLLNVHPYLLDFFSLARGYGLACGFSMMSLYYLYRFLELQKITHILLCLLGAVLAVLSNFTFLNYFAILAAFLGIWTLAWNHQQGANKWIPLGITGCTTALLGIMLYKPIIFLKGGGEFGYGVSSLWITFQQLIRDNLYGQAYFSASTVPIFLWIAIIFVGISVLYGLLQAFQASGHSAHFRHFYLATSLMWVLLILSLFTQYYLLGTQFLHKRTALIFFPISMLPVFLFLLSWLPRFKKSSQLVAVVLSIFAIYHFSRAANMVYCREWYYDAHTEEMIDYIKSKATDHEKINLGVYWLFTHSANFYRETQKLDFLENIVYERQIRTDSLYDYYYVEPGHGQILHSDYELEKRFGYVAVLYKRRP